METELAHCTQQAAIDNTQYFPTYKYFKVKQNMIDKIREEWNSKVGVPMNEKPTVIHTDKGILMAKLFYEEFLEYMDAHKELDKGKRMIDIADAIGDMTYILYGTINQYGMQNSWSRFRKMPVTNTSINFHINELMINIRKGLIMSIESSLESLEAIVYDLWDKHGISKHRHAVMEEIHRSNLSKIYNGILIKNNDGKVTKPEKYSPPDLSFVLN